MTNPRFYEDETFDDQGCALPECGIRRDEHADQDTHGLPFYLTITEHTFKEEAAK